MRISNEKKDKICEQILNYLYIENPKPLFVSNISKEIARDEEYIKKLVLELKEKKLLIEIKKNNKGLDYLKRSRWKLSKEAYKIYSEKQKQF